MACRHDKQRARGLHVLVWLNDTFVRFMSRAIVGACDEAARFGYLDILKYAATGVTITSDAASYAANMGHVHVLEWMRSTFQGNNPFGYPAKTLSSLTNAGGVWPSRDILQWAHSHGFLCAPDRLFKAAGNYVQDETAAWLYETFGHEACYGEQAVETATSPTSI